MPINLDVTVMYYNRDMFDAQDVAYPQAGWSWQDFLDSAHRLTTIETGKGQQAGHWGFVSHPAFGDLFPFVLQHGGAILDDPLKPTRPIFDDPVAAEAIQWYADLGLVHKVMPIVQREKIDELSRFPTDAFALRQAAMVIGGVSDRGGDIIPWDFAWGVVPLPHDQAPGSWMLVRGYYIAAQTGYPQETWTLVHSLAGAETSRVPAHRSMAESDAFRRRVGEDLADAVLATLDNGNLWLMFTGTRSYEWYRRFTGRAYWVVVGDDTAEEMMDKLQGELANWSFEEL
jgi:multiple sugar transport system substrate-binding protein